MSRSFSQQATAFALCGNHRISYQYDMQPPRLVSLSGVQMALREFGDPSGHPLFFFHGWPGSGGQCWLLDEAARAHGFRGFAFDRPGIGTSPIQTRSLLDWPPLIRSFAADLGFQKFAILGISGGGPYALACASQFPELLSAVGVVCGAPPISELANIQTLHPTYRFLLKLFRRRPSLVKALFHLARPWMVWTAGLQFFPPTRIMLPRPDATALDTPKHFAHVFGCQMDAFQSVEGLFADAQIYAHPWGFSLEAIDIPIQFWHGREDGNFHYTLAEEMAGRVPKARLQIVENEGHFSLPIRQSEMILKELAATCRANGHAVLS